MNIKRWHPHFFLMVLAAVTVLGALAIRIAAGEEDVRVQPAGTPSENLVVPMCDGKSQLEVPGYKPGDKLDRDAAQKVADAMMAQWRRMNPGASWEMAAAAPAAQKAETKKQDEIYGRFSDRDRFVWKTELEKFIKEGDRIFHDAEAFGGTVGVSCDMCHPHASNTHPETYPKYQVQLQRVALLRDMINWCIQHATKGKPLADDDQRLRAMEAYILAQRKGQALEPGKH